MASDSPVPDSAEPRNPDVSALRKRALEALTLAIELFNRPHNCARRESVLILLHHSFEMLLKSIIVERTGTAFDEATGYSYTFDTCLRFGTERLEVLTKDHRKFLSMLDNLRDCAAHYYQDVSESVLYVFAQGSVSLFNEVLRKTTGNGLSHFLPTRVLPISSIPPGQLARVVDDEFNRLGELLHDAAITPERARAILRPLLAFKIAAEDAHRRPTTAELDAAVENLASADNWRMVFPEIARVSFASEGEALTVGFKIVNNAPDALSARVAKPGEAEDTQALIIQKEINIFDKFNMWLYQMAEHLSLSGPRVLEMIREHAVEKDPEMFRQLRIGSQTYKRYSKKALDLLRERKDTVEACWAKQRESLSRRKRT